MALRTNYAKLHESHDRIAEEQRQERERQARLEQENTRRQQEKQQAKIEQEQRQQQHVAPKNNYHKTLDADEDRQQRWADAKLAGDLDGEEKIRQELADKGYRPNEITNQDLKADQLAQQQLTKQQLTKQQQQAQAQPDREARKQAFLAKRNGGPTLEQDPNLDMDD